MAVNYKNINSNDLIENDNCPLLEDDGVVLGLGNNNKNKEFKHGKNQKGINHKHYEILALHLSGKTVQEISSIVGYSPVSIYRILKDEELVLVRQQILSGIGDEFEVLFVDVVNTIRELLQSNKEAIRLEACEKWLKAHNKYGQSKNTIQVTAEDVVFQILNNK